MWNTEPKGFDPGLLSRGRGILAAVSGGADSMCLLHLLTRWGQENGVIVVCAHFDHHLRENSRRDAEFVADWCEKQSIPFVLGEGDVASEAAARGQGLEETARALRYAFLEGTAAKLGGFQIATAHNADDNAETLLLHLIRGSGLKGLTGIPTRRGNIIRPLLGVSRREIEAYNEANAIPHVEDESNSDIRFTRNYIRHRVMPLLRELNPEAAAALNRTARSLREDEALLDKLAGEIPFHREGELVWAEGSHLAEAPQALALRTVQRMVEELEEDLVLPDGRRREVLALMGEEKSPSGELHLPGGLTARRRYDRLELLRREKDPLPGEVTLSLPGELDWGCGKLTVTKTIYRGEIQLSNDFYVRDVGDRLILRPRREGDVLAPVGRNTKSLKKWMIDEKIPRPLRQSLPVLVWGEEIGGVPGLGCSKALHPQPGEAAWHCEFFLK